MKFGRRIPPGSLSFAASFSGELYMYATVPSGEMIYLKPESGGLHGFGFRGTKG